MDPGKSLGRTEHYGNVSLQVTDLLQRLNPGKSLGRTECLCLYIDVYTSLQLTDLLNRLKVKMSARTKITMGHQTLADLC